MTAIANAETPNLPDMKVSVRQLFGFDSNIEVPAYSKADEHVPDLDEDYLFNRETTLAILAGFAYNRRVMITGYHGTGKSHISSKSRLASTGRASASISTATSAASISSARMPSSSRMASRSPNSA